MPAGREREKQGSPIFLSKPALIIASPLFYMHRHVHAILSGNVSVCQWSVSGRPLRLLPGRGETEKHINATVEREEIYVCCNRKMRETLYTPGIYGRGWACMERGGLYWLREGREEAYALCASGVLSASCMSSNQERLCLRKQRNSERLYVSRAKHRLSCLCKHMINVCSLLYVIY